MGSLCFSQSQITINGNSGGAVSPVSYYQRPFSPSAYSLPASLNSSIIMQHGRSLDSAETYSQHAQSLDGTMGSSIPLYRSSEEEKRVTVIKAPHYPGIGPVDESGIPTAIRTVSHACQHMCPSGSVLELHKGWIVHSSVHS
uniref:SoHo domain-containing protein n=1 Tax=Mus spicilegus TaxID=10103 RepID=A0A8C6G675_MUSSI